MAVDTSRISRLLFIENRTNYESYINGEHQTESRRTTELVVYHGGYHGPAKSRFFRMLVRALPAGAQVLYWGDIDLGGLRIFQQIRSNIAPGLQPWRMDAQTLLANRDKALPFSDNYRQALEKALADPAMQDFRDVIESMLATGLRLEQEALIE